MIGHSVIKRQFCKGTKKSIGIVGIGNIGFPMMKSLIKHGHGVTVFDTVQEKMDRAREEGATTARDIAELSKDKDAGITILPTSEEVWETRMGVNGIFKNARKGSLVIDSSTVAPDITREMTEKGEALGLRIADVPISGGYMGAEEGTLTCMIGCRKKDYDEIEEIYKGMGTNLFYGGEPGTGMAAKICNNMALAINNISICEALALGYKMGIDQKTLAKIISVSTGSCWPIKVKGPVKGMDPTLPADNNFDHGFESKLMKKDISLVLKEAEQVNIDLQFAKKAYEYYSEIEKKGLGNKDIGIMLHHILDLKQR